MHNDNNTEFTNRSGESDGLSLESMDFTGVGGTVVGAKDPIKTSKRLLMYFKQFRLLILFAITAAILATSLALMGPQLLKDMIDHLTLYFTANINMQAITRLGLILTLIYSISACLNSVQGWIMATVTQKMTKTLRSNIELKLNRLPMWYFHQHSTGDILSRITNDADAVGQNLNNSLTTLIASITMLIGSLVLMLNTNWILTLTAIFSVVSGFIIMIVVMSFSQKHFDSQQLFLGKINGHIEEAFSGHATIKVYNGEKHMHEAFQALNVKLEKNTFMAQFLSGLMMPIMTFVDNAGYVAVTVVGAALVINGDISFGVIVAFLLYVRFFSQPLTQIAQLGQGMQMAIAAGERIFTFLDAQEMENEHYKDKVLHTVQGKVEFKNVNFGYEGTDKTIIHDFSFCAHPGQKIAIVGPTGAGKTTLVNLVMRFNEIQHGEIMIDDIPIRQLTRENVHSLFCMVLQDTWLFEGTIRENLVFNQKNVSDRKLKTACEAVGIYHFITTLPQGFDTILNDHVNLSAGQRQQLTIARAMIDDAPMLILDEATSSIDTRTEVLIQNAMDVLMEGRTAFVIAHRLSTIKNADVILVLRDGDIVEQGNHHTLMQKNGYYTQLYNSQFETA